MSFPKDQLFGLIQFVMTANFDRIEYLWCLVDKQTHRIKSIEPRKKFDSFIFARGVPDTLVSCSLNDDLCEIGVREINTELSVSKTSFIATKRLNLSRNRMTIPTSFGFLISNNSSNFFFDYHFSYEVKAVLISTKESSHRISADFMNIRNGSRLNMRQMTCNDNFLFFPNISVNDKVYKFRRKGTGVDKTSIIFLPELDQYQLVISQRFIVYLRRSGVLKLVNRLSKKKALGETQKTVPNFYDPIIQSGVDKGTFYLLYHLELNLYKVEQGKLNLILSLPQSQVNNYDLEYRIMVDQIDLTFFRMTFDYTLKDKISQFRHLLRKEGYKIREVDTLNVKAEVHSQFELQKDLFSVFIDEKKREFVLFNIHDHTNSSLFDKHNQINFSIFSKNQEKKVEFNVHNEDKIINYFSFIRKYQRIKSINAPFKYVLFCLDSVNETVEYQFIGSLSQIKLESVSANHFSFSFLILNRNFVQLDKSIQKANPIYDEDYIKQNEYDYLKGTFRVPQKMQSLPTFLKKDSPFNIKIDGIVLYKI